MIMEHKVGEIFEYNGEWFQCIEGYACINCAFHKETCSENYIYKTIGSCKYYRTDNHTVIFKKLEKVGEPFYTGFYCSWVQKYKLYDNHAIGEYPKCHFGADYVLIELKQDKEDMEGNTNLYEEQTPLQKLMEVYCDGRMDYDEFENKVKELYSDNEDSKPTLKPFDIEEAKAGKPVCTRDGRKVRIVCFDRIDAKPILALIKSNNGKGEMVLDYFINGKRIANANESDYDLMMLPEKKYGWVNVYSNPTTHNIYTSADVFESKEIAEEQGTPRNRIATCKINWEE